MIKARLLCQTILQPLRTALAAEINQDVQIKITSGKRSKLLYQALNDAGLNPSPNSDHSWHLGSVACDFMAVTDGVPNEQATARAYHLIPELGPNAFGQLIYYPKLGHIHISLPTAKNWRSSWIQN